MAINQQHARLMKMASGAALATALFLVAAKAVAWWMSGSVSLLAGLTDSLLDGAASLINLIAVHYALQPADEDHRFGHGKAEALAGLGQAVFIAISAVLVGVNGVDRLLNPEPLEATAAGMAVSVLAIVMTFILLLFQRHVVKVTGSTAINADSLHYRSDLLLNGSILLALFVSSWGWQSADALFGIAIAFYILWSSLEIVRESAAVLMDEELPEEVRERMTQLAAGVSGVLGAHDLRTRKSGTRWFVQLHLDLPELLSLKEAHDLCEAVEREIMGEFPRAEVLVHADPRMT